MRSMVEGALGRGWERCVPLSQDNELVKRTHLISALRAPPPPLSERSPSPAARGRTKDTP